MNHHTKNKGDIGVLKVMADLLEHGIHSCLPVSEHLPFDLVAVYPDGSLKRVSVKYRCISSRGILHIPFSSCYSTAKGARTVKIDKGMIDLLAVYCPDTKEVYYLNPDDFGADVSLRITPSKNNQRSGVHYAKNYMAP